MSKRLEAAMLYLLLFAGFYSVAYEVRKLNRIVLAADIQRTEVRQRQRTQRLVWVDLPNVYRPTHNGGELPKQPETK